MIQNVHIVAQSSNSKTGPIPATYRPESTCPDTCPFLRNGCYGTGRIFHLADKYSQSLAVQDAIGILRKARKDARLIRDRVVGDVVNASGDIDWDYLVGISWASFKSGMQVFGYTHAWRLFSRWDVIRLKRMGYVMNASTESLQDARQAIALGFPVVITNAEIPEGTTVDGRRIVTCPAQTRDDVNCATCGLCAKPDRKAIIRFIPHGSAKRLAERAITAMNA